MISLFSIGFYSCDNEISPVSPIEIPPTGNMVCSVTFGDQYDNRVPYSDIQATVLIEGEGISKSGLTNNLGQVEFKDLPLGNYTVKTLKEGGLWKTCKIAERTISEEKLTNYASFYLQEIPTSNIDVFRIDSLSNQGYLYWSIQTSPIVDKVRTIRVYYGNDCTVSKDNYISTSFTGAGWNILNGNLNDPTDIKKDYIDLTDFSSISDSIYAAVYIAAKGYTYCTGLDGKRIYSPVKEPPVVVGFKK